MTEPEEALQLTESVYNLDENGGFTVTDEVKQSYQQHGYIVIKSVLSEEEVEIINKCWTDDPYMIPYKYDQGDDEGAQMKLTLWDDASNDGTGLFSRSQKIAATIQELLGDEVYHYHAKFLEKPPLTGGSFIWHQDYGYWYYNGNLFPDDMCTAILAVDDCNIENGCLKIVPGSHHVGRIDHIKYDEQIQADLERVDHYVERMGMRHAVLKKGDVIIFHSNVLHRSDKNESEKRRLMLAVAYNTKRNNPIKVHHHPQYKPMTHVDNGALLRWANEGMKWDDSKHFYNPQKDSKAHMDVIETKK